MTSEESGVLERPLLEAAGEDVPAVEAAVSEAAHVAEAPEGRAVVEAAAPEATAPEATPALAEEATAAEVAPAVPEVAPAVVEVAPLEAAPVEAAVIEAAAVVEAAPLEAAAVVEAAREEAAVVEAAPVVDAPVEAAAAENVVANPDEEFVVGPVNYDEPGLFEVDVDEVLYRFDAGKQGTAICLSKRPPSSWRWNFLGELRWDGRDLRSRALDRNLLQKLSIELRTFASESAE